MNSKKSFSQIYIYTLVAITICLVLISSNNFIFDIFGDRDLLRSYNLKNSFEVYGADFGMQNGRRIPGGFNYYYLYFLTHISNNVLILNYLSLLIIIFSFTFLLISNRKWIGINGLLFSAIFFLTSETFIYQIKKFWNPSLGLPFVIFSLTFFLQSLSKKNSSYLTLSFIFTFLASQFHISYSIFALIFFILTIYFRSISFWKTLLIFFSSIALAYLPLIINYFILLVDQNFNDYYLINQIDIKNKEEVNILLWFIKKILVKLQLAFESINYKIIINFIILLSIITIFTFLKKKIITYYNEHRQNIIFNFLIMSFLLIILFNNEFSSKQLIFFSSTIILGLMSGYLIVKKNFYLNVELKNDKIFFNTIFFIFLSIVFISSLAYSLTFGTFSIVSGDISRYSLSLLPISSLIQGYCLAVVFLWFQSNKFFLSKIIRILIILLLTFKVFIFYNYHIKSSKIFFEYNYNARVLMIDTIEKEFNLTKEDFYTKVAFLLIADDQPKLLTKPSFQNYINYKIDNKDKIKFNNCVLGVINNFENDYNKSNLEKVLKKLQNNLNLFGSKINIIKKIESKDFFLLEYKVTHGDCPKGILNDYIITKKEKDTLKFLLNKNNNLFYKVKVEDYSKYYLKIYQKKMLYPADILIELAKKKDGLDILLVSKRLRNSDTYLNGYWDSTNFHNSKLVFMNNSTGEVFDIYLSKGALGKGFLKTPWKITTSDLVKGNYTVSLQIEKLEEKFSKVKLDDLKFLVDDNYEYK